MGEKSSAEQISFIFYKLANMEPDFDFWTEEYTKQGIKAYGELGKRDYILKTRQRLENAFTNTRAEDETIIIHKMATLEPLSVSEHTPDERFINIYFEESPPFIAQRIPEYNVNIVVPDLEEQVKLYVNKQEYKRLDQLFYGGIKKRNQVSIKLFLKPVAADVANPLEYKGHKYVLLLTKLKEFEIWSDIQREQYWPLPPSEEELKAAEEKQEKDNFFSKYK